MASTTANTSMRQAYKATVSLSYLLDGTTTAIVNERISYFLIEDSYQTMVMPVIYVNMNVPNDLFNNIIKYKEKGKFLLSINKVNAYSTAAISKRSISGEFSYIPADSNPNYSETLAEDGTSMDTAYRNITVGLISLDLTNELRTSTNGIFSNIDQNTLISKAMEGLDCVIEPPIYNNSFESIIVPPLSSRYKLIDFIFKKSPFYDTNFVYFMDFDKSYLLSKAGNAIDAKDSQLQNIIIDIKSVTADEAYYEGMQIVNGNYYVYVNPSNTNITIDSTTEKVANQIVAVNDSGTQTMDLSINQTEGSTVKQTFIRTDNPILYKNEIECSTIVVELMKQNIDGNIFTPNKCIMINNFEQYSQYNGKYTLLYKKEFIKSVAGEFVCGTTIGLKKIGNIQAIGLAPSTASARSSINTTATASDSLTSRGNTVQKTRPF